MGKNLNYPQATYFSNGVQTDVGMLFNVALTTPTASSTYVLYMDSLYNLYWWNGTSATPLNFEAAVTATPGSGNGETLPITGNTIFYDPNGASRTGVIVTAGLRDGQRVTIVNIANAAETITFAAAGTSNVAGGASVSIARFECLTLLWNAATSLWYCMGAGL